MLHMPDSMDTHSMYHFLADISDVAKDAEMPRRLRNELLALVRNMTIIMNRTEDEMDRQMRRGTLRFYGGDIA